MKSHFTDFGALVMMDALGFKGIWKPPNSLQKVLQRLRVIEDAILEVRQAPNIQVAEHLGFKIRVSYLSDTIIVACTQEPVPGLIDNSSGLLAVAAGWPDMQLMPGLQICVAAILWKCRSRTGERSHVAGCMSMTGT